MAWDRDTPRRMPHNWAQIKAAVRLAYGDVCMVCGKAGTDEVNHIIAWAEGGTDDVHNLRPIHSKPCHQDITQQQAAEGRRRSQARLKRPQKPHPGLM